MNGCKKCRAVLVLAPRLSPTRDFYLPRVKDQSGGAPIKLQDASAYCYEQLSLESGTWAVILRHTHPSWIRYLLKKREDLARVTWFIDDDIPSMLRETSLPRFYALKTYARYHRIKSMLQRLGADYAFSTVELAHRYPDLNGEVWSPQQVNTKTARNRVLYFYHGTVSHRAELRWLAPVVAEIQHRVPEAWFEVFADKMARELFRGIPRVRCIYPMDWPDFVTHTETIRADVGLAMLLDTSFNHARAPVKFFDITRTGAAGIYSTGPVYDNIVKNGVNGLLVPNEPKRWVEAIIRLLQSPAERLRLATQASRDCGTAAEK